MIDNIVVLASLPVGILLFLKVFGITEMDTLFGLSLLLIAAIVVIIVQIANIVGAHIQDENVVLSYIIHTLLIFPAVLYFLSLVITFPASLTAALPVMMASFILSEGLYSFFF
jgi:hypothetical protein